MDYTQWQSSEHDEEPRDQQRDLDGRFWAEVGPDDRHAPDGWAWTIIKNSEEVADGYVADEDAAKRAVQKWADDNLRRTCPA